MFYTYILRSHPHPQKLYTGSTQDLRTRLTSHNQSKSKHTAKFAPWHLIFYAAFPQQPQSQTFEKYLKTASGRSFAKKHLLELCNN